MNYKKECDRVVAIDPATGAEIGQLTFTRIGDDLVSFDHTFVQSDYGGQGIAAELLENAVELMRGENRKVISNCSYVTAVFSKGSQYDDVKTSRN